MAFSTQDNDQITNNAVVIDNSVMMRWLFKDGSEEDQQYAQKVLHQINEGQLLVLVPYIWVYESSFVVSFYQRKELITVEEATKHLDALFELCTVVRGEERPKVLFHFANEHKLSSYDSSYILLTQQAGCSIATLDKTMIKATMKLELKVFA